MMLISSFIEKYVGKPFEIDCLDIDIHGSEDNRPPIFKGPGVIRGDSSGSLSFKVFNQIELNIYIANFLKQFDIGQKVKVRFLAIDYNGVQWKGGWSIPTLTLFQTTSMLVYDEFDQLYLNFINGG